MLNFVYSDTVTDSSVFARPSIPHRCTMNWISDAWQRFVTWIDSLGPREAAVLGAIGLVVLGGIGKYVFLPVSQWLFKRVTNILDPLLSGAILLDQIWGKPRYLKQTRAALERLRNPWLWEGARLSDVFVPVLASSAQVNSGGDFDLHTGIRQYKAAVIIGGPGSGKTTALKAFGIQSMVVPPGNSSLDRRTPIFISLRAFGDSEVTLWTYLVSHLQEHGFPRPERFLKREAKRGRLVFLLDALDEVDPQKCATVLHEIRMLIVQEVHRGNRVYLSSRPGTYEGQLHDVVNKTLYMVDFSPSQIRTFISNCEFRPPKSGAILAGVINDRPPILEICRNPLMLTIATYLYRDTDYQLPESREEFYKTCVDALLRRWDVTKDLEKRNHFPPDLKHVFLEELAARALESQRLDLSLDLLFSSATAFLEKRQPSADQAAFIEEVIRSGLLIRLPTSEIFFAHKTLAESLAATHLKGSPQKLIERWQKSPAAWLEVVSLYVADVRTPEDDIATVLTTAKQMGNLDTHVILAGEAYVCPEPQKSELLNRIEAQNERWESLSRRAFAGLGRLGESARPLLTQMLTRGSPAIRQGAVFALGYVGQKWAMDLIAMAFEDNTTRKVAVEALASLGDRALPIVREVVDNGSSSAAAGAAGMRVLQKIGSVDATLYLVTLLRHPNTVVRYEAAQGILKQASEKDGMLVLHRAAQKLNIVLDPASSALLKWAFPLEKESSKLTPVYAQVVATVRDTNRPSEGDGSPTAASSLPLSLVVPMAIELSQPALLQEWIRGRRYVQYGSQYSVGVPGLLTLFERSPQAEVRHTWSSVLEGTSRDIAISGSAFSAISMLLTGVLAAPVVLCVVREYLSPAWLLLPAIPIGVRLATWAEEGGEAGIEWATFPGVLPAVLKSELYRMQFDGLRRPSFLTWLMFLSVIAFAASWFVSVPLLPIGFLATPAAWFLTVWFESDGRELRIPRTRNPFRGFVEIEKAERGSSDTESSMNSVPALA